MAKYLYNDMELPKLPEWDKEKYPHAVICLYDYPSDSYVHDVVLLYLLSDIKITNEQTVLDGSIYKDYMWHAVGDTEYRIERPSDSTENFSAWGEETTLNDSLAFGLDNIVWTNTDLYYTDGNLYLAASDPVPVSTTPTNADYYIRKNGKWYKNKGGASSGTSSGGTGTVSWNDLTDKPFGDESVTIEWDGDSTGKITNDDGNMVKVSDLTPDVSILVGGNYHVETGETHDITEDKIADGRAEGYPIAFVDDGVVTIVYEPLTGYPEKGIYFFVGGGVYISSLTYGSTKKLDPKYLPESIYGTSGTVTLTTANWTDGVYTLTMEDMGENDAIFFTPSTKADKTALEDANVFIGTEGQTVTLEADTTPTADITLDYFIVRGA